MRGEHCLSGGIAPQESRLFNGVGEHELRKWDINGSSLFLGQISFRLPWSINLHQGTHSRHKAVTLLWAWGLCISVYWVLSWFSAVTLRTSLIPSFSYSRVSLSLSFVFLLHYEACGLPRSITQSVKNLPAVQETWVRFLSQEDPLEKKKATHSSFLTWKIPWTEEFCGLQLMGSQRVGHNWVTNSFWGMWDLSSLAKHWNPCPTAVEAWSLNHWTTREVPRGVSLSHLQIEFGLNGTWEWAGGGSWGWLKWEIWWQAVQWHHSESCDNSPRAWRAVLWTSESSPHLISRCSYEESTSIFPNRLHGNFDKFARFV